MKNERYMVLVEWRDAYASHADFDIKDVGVGDLGDCIFQTAGILIHEDEDFITLATDEMTVGPDNCGKFRSPMRIPTPWAKIKRKIKI